MFTNVIWFRAVKLAAVAALTAGVLPAPCPNCLGMPAFGVIGINPGDTLRLNVSLPTDPIRGSGPCVVQASIVQPATFGCDFGVCPATTLAGPVTLTLSPGQSDGLEFIATFAVGAVARLTPVSDPATTCLNLRGSVEVYDTPTRRSRLLAPGVPTDPILPVDPMTPAGPWRFPLAGLTSADTIRVNLFYITPPDPVTPPSNCTVQATVPGSRGHPGHEDGGPEPGPVRHTALLGQHHQRPAAGAPAG